MRRYVRLFGVQLRASLAMAMQYRLDFFLEGLLSLWWVLWTLLPLWIVFGARASIAGWSFPEALVVLAWFTVLRALLEGVLNPTLPIIVDHIRTGTFDFILVKPADAQFLVSTTKFSLWKAFDVAAGLIMLAIAFSKIGRFPAAQHLVVGVALLLAGALVLYSLWILVISAAFWVVRLDNLAYLLTAVFDAARWPLSIFRGAWKVIFTFLIPLGLMTTYPAMAVLGRLDTRTAFAAFVGTIAIFVIARLVWTRALGRYTSASS